jgi:hypothetical protein
MPKIQPFDARSVPAVSKPLLWLTIPMVVTAGAIPSVVM